MSNLGGGKTIEETYQKLDPREHVLKRPDTYMGTMDPVKESRWIMNTETNRMQKTEVTTIEAFHKIFDEILVNALDHWTRLDGLIATGQKNVTPVKNIRVDVDREKGVISVENDGDGIDVIDHEEQKIPIPQMIFSNLLTGVNYDDDSGDRVVGGRNGYGAKLTNIMSKEFILETVDPVRKLLYIQKFTDNMSNIHPPEITKYTKKPYTKITYTPDFERFGITDIPNSDNWPLLESRVYDAVGWTNHNVGIYLNGTKLKIKDFEDYVNLYIGNKRDTKRVYIKPHSRWELVVCLSPHFPPHMEQISMVNGVVTDRGGKHITHVVDTIGRKLAKWIKDNNKTKKGGPDIKEAFIKNHLWVFVKCQIVNPSFDTQTKRHLTTGIMKFGSRCDVTDEFIEKVSKIGILEKAKELAKINAMIQLGKKNSGSKKSKIKQPKLEDAKDAGTKKSEEAYLVLTEGDSAAAFVEAGVKALTPTERGKIGWMPLRGKLLNTRTATHKQLENNAEIKAIMKACGLTFGIDYSNNTKLLRYRRIMILTDADTDGDHIKGLIINFISHYWPSLLKIGFVGSFPTPIIKVWKPTADSIETGVPDEKTQLDFYSTEEYEEWNKTSIGKWSVKYYKGLGTHTPTEAERCFKIFKPTIYTWDSDKIEYKGAQVDKTEHIINLMFAKKYENDRKKWIVDYINGDKQQLSYLVDKESLVIFFNNRMIRFSVEDCERSIPSLVDGLKPSQRKILFSAIKKNLKNEIKVAQFAGYVSEHSGYHHGEISLSEAITSMGNNYVGSKNLNLLTGIGTFGTRKMNGKNAGAARYIKCKLSSVVTKLINPLDNAALNFLTEDDGTSKYKIEPEYYVPVLPLLLINGSNGIGTGSSTTIPCFNPEDIIANINRYMKGEPMIHMAPWYRGFQGTIDKINDTKYIAIGSWHKLGKNKIKITELPVGSNRCKSYEAYKIYLESLLDDEEVKNKKKEKDDSSTVSLPPGTIVDYDTTLTDVSFTAEVTFKEGYLESILGSDMPKYAFEKKMRLAEYIGLTNLVAYNAKGELTKYDSPIDILKAWCDVRFKYYIKRKVNMMTNLLHKRALLNAKYRFVSEIMEDKINIYKKSKKAIHAILDGTAETGAANPPYPKHNKSEDSTEETASYEYLLSMRIDSFSTEVLERIAKDIPKNEDEITKLEGTTEQDMWVEDLGHAQSTYETDIATWFRLTKIPIPVVKKAFNIKSIKQKDIITEKTKPLSIVPKKQKIPFAKK